MAVANRETSQPIAELNDTPESKPDYDLTPGNNVS